MELEEFPFRCSLEIYEYMAYLETQTFLVIAFRMVWILRLGVLTDLLKAFSTN